jgi:hypothetical protein
MGINPHDVVDLNNKALVIKMLKGMVRVECGPPPTGTANGDWLDDSVYEAARSLTRPMTASRTARGSVADAVATRWIACDPRHAHAGAGEYPPSSGNQSKSLGWSAVVRPVGPCRETSMKPGIEARVRYVDSSPRRFRSEVNHN